MVHVIAALGVFFAFLITSTAWVMVKIGGFALVGLAIVVGGAWLLHRKGRRGRKP